MGCDYDWPEGGPAGMIENRTVNKKTVNKKTFQLQAELSGVSYMKDGGISLRFTTEEVRDHEKRVMVSEHHGQYGVVLFKPNETHIPDEDIPDYDVTDERKTPSQRLRAVLFVWWKQLQIGDDTNETDFELFYRRKMEAIIGQVKLKLK